MSRKLEEGRMRVLDLERVAGSVMQTLFPGSVRQRSKEGKE